MEGTARGTPASPGGAVQAPRSRGESTGNQKEMEMERRQATQDQARLPTAASFFRREGQDGALGNQCVTQVIGARAVSALRTQAWSSQSVCSPPPPQLLVLLGSERTSRGPVCRKSPRGLLPLVSVPSKHFSCVTFQRCLIRIEVCSAFVLGAQVVPHCLHHWLHSPTAEEPRCESSFGSNVATSKHIWNNMNVHH